MENESPLCEGCEKELPPVDVVMGWNVCMDCTKARHRAVVARKCICGKKRRNSEVHKAYSRRWISCLRCLGTVKQLS